MLDQNKLNRIHRILSAKTGTLVPKFLNPAGPLKTVQHTVNNLKVTSYSSDGINWFEDEGLTRVRTINNGDLDPGAVYRSEKNDAAVNTAMGVPNISPKKKEQVEITAGSDAGTINTGGLLSNTEKMQNAVENAPQTASLVNLVTAATANTSSLGSESSVVTLPTSTVTPTVATPPILPTGVSDPMKDVPNTVNAPNVVTDTTSEGNVAPLNTGASNKTLVGGVGNDNITTNVDASGNVVGLGADGVIEDTNIAGNIAETIGSKGGNKLKDVVGKVSGKASELFGGGQSPAGSIANGVVDTMSNLLIDKSEFASDSFTNSKGRQIYDTVADTAAMFGPVGTVVSGGMKAGMFINDLFATKALDFAVDQDTVAQVGSSYGGSVDTIQDGAEKAGKKYGLFEGTGAADEIINKARRLQLAMGDIAKDSKDLLSNTYLTDFASKKYSVQVNGGYNLKYARAAKLGGIIEEYDDFEIIITDPEIPEFKTGGVIDGDDWEPIITDDVSEFKTGGKIRKNEEGEIIPEKCDECGGEIIVKIQGEPVYLCKECNKYFGVAPFKHKEGGTIKDSEIEVVETNTTQKSVIPEGALHKNKHHLDEVGIDDSELTKKGIPVVDNHGEQQAEIELNEIIFTLEVTKELEKRYKEFYNEETSTDRKNELALEAGKLLWKEIIYNTDDRTGLIDTLKLGGVIKAQEGMQIPDALRVEKPKIAEPKIINIKEISKKLPYKIWVKMVPKEWQSNNYDLETAYKYLPLEQLNRWLFAINSEDPNYYMNYTDPETGEYIYHLGSIAPYGDGEYIFLKKGKEDTNPELHWETDTYHNGTNGLKETHDLVYNDKEGRYFYKKKKLAKKHSEGGKASADFIKYIKYLPVKTLSPQINFPTSKLDLMITPEVTNEPLENPSLKTELTSPIWELPQSSVVSKEKTLPTNLNLEGWDLNKTLKHLREHAHDKSTHYCAKYVREALEAGGLTGFRVPNAKNEVKLNTLASIGFTKIADALDNKVTSGYKPLAGDVAISYENGNHAAMYDGTRWISDFKLNNLDVYNSLKNTKTSIYRRTKSNLPKQEFSVFENSRNFALNHNI